jgi:transcriptional regulator with XRE-family HTH domain
MAQASPTVRQRELGQRLRRLRHDLDLTVDAVASKLLCSVTKISRIETGTRRASLRDVRDLCRLYEVGEEVTAELLGLARQAREPGWYAQYEDLDLDPYIGMEQEATEITFFSNYWLHGLMQTEDYARAIIKAIAPKIDQQVLEERVEARMRRQQLLEPPTRPRFRSLLDEAVIRREVGGPRVMRDQLGKIIRMIGEEQATVQVIPFYAGAYASADGNFSLLEFANSGVADLVYVEGLTCQLYQERETEIGRYREALEYLRGAALSPRDSLRLIEDVRDYRR